MKKVFSLILAFVLCLPLYACGDSNQTPQTDPKTQLLSSATELQCGTLFEDFDDNQLKATEKYVDKAFTVTGYIYDINTDNLQLTPFAPAIDWTTFEGCTVYLPTEELMQVKKGEIVTIVGKVSRYSSGSMFSIVMEEAYLVSNVISITATVGEITLFDDSNGTDYYYVPLTTVSKSSGQAMFAQEFWYKLGATRPSEITINGISVETGDKVRMEVTGEKNNEIFNKKSIIGEYIFPMFIESVSSISVVE